jgi:hypothetical protein
MLMIGMPAAIPRMLTRAVLLRKPACQLQTN